MDTHWIDRPEELSDFVDGLDEKLVAIDSESDHYHAYRTRVCLLQVATREQVALVDPLALETSDLEPFFELCRNGDVVHILHSARNDIHEFDRDWCVGIDGLFDTQIAARFLGYARNSLSWLVEQLLGADAGESFHRFDWTTRPLPDDARRYAATDVAHLFPLYDRFSAELDETGWREPFEQHCRYVARTTAHQPSDFDPEGWREIDGAADLEDRQRAVLRALYRWRHRVCDEVNRAAVHVLPDDAMVEVAGRDVGSADELAAIDRVPDETIRQRTEPLLEAVRRGREAEVPNDAPADEEEESDTNSPSPRERARFDDLRAWRNRTANQFDIPKPFVATNATLSEVAAEPPTDLDDLHRFDAILEWHSQLLGPEIVEAANRDSPTASDD